MRKSILCLSLSLGVSISAFANSSLQLLNPANSDLMAIETSKGTLVKPVPVKDQRMVQAQFEVFAPNKSAYLLGDAPTGMSPDQIRQAYGMQSSASGKDQGGGYIAIVDAGLSDNVIDNANQFNRKYGLPLFKSGDNGNITVIKTGYTKLFNHSWEIETTLDLEAAHLMAPAAHIILVQTGSPLSGALAKGLSRAASELAQVGGGQISMSWGSTGDQDVNKPLSEAIAKMPANVTLFAASGDKGASQAIYPASSDSVVAVGGTCLHVDSDGNYQSQSAWTGSGGGLSLFYDRPNYQAEYANLVGTHAGIPDISLDADPNSGVLVYASADIFSKAGFELVGGTSLAAPLAAGLHNVFVTQQGNDAGNTNALLQTYYSHVGDVELFDVNIPGINGNLNHDGHYDLVTGLGAPKKPL